MAQLGILFDAQKLGSGFYGYTAFRILFSVIPPRELGGCSLYHGEVGDGRVRPYCIAVECDSAALLTRVRQMFTASMARGLMPLNSRFLDDGALSEEVLALAARISLSGEMTDCQSRWLQEAYQRAQGQAALAVAEPRPPLPPVRTASSPGASQAAQEAKTPSVQLPAKVPMVLRWSSGGRKALAFLVAFSAGGAAVPWLGWGIAACVAMFVAGAVQGIAMRWKLEAEDGLSGEDVLSEARKLLGGKPLHEVAEKLREEPLQASPLLRRVHVTTRSSDLSAACLMASQHVRADALTLRADVREVRTQAWGVVGAALCSLVATTVFQGQPQAVAEGPRLALAGVGGCLLLHWMANLLAIRGERMESAIQRSLAAQWLPALAKAMPAPKTHFDGLEQALRDVAQEFQAMRTSLERRRDGELVETMSDIRSSLDQLTPVLAGFREPFVFQAVPAPAAAPNARPKAMSATA